MTFQPSSVLLDKSIVRRVYERRVRLALGQTPTPLQVEADNVYSRVCALTSQVYITEQTFHILQLRTPVFAAAIIADTRTMKKGRYLRRWARRLRELSFSPEDAIVLAYGSFGVDLLSQIAGAEAIVTGDLKLAAHFNAKHSEIKEKFENMISNLSEPYNKLSLPAVVTTAFVLASP